MDKRVSLQITNVVATVATLIVNALASLLPLNGMDTGAISDMFEVYFVPAGYVFSIWGVIYLGMIAFSVYQALPARRREEGGVLDRIGYLYAGASAANVVWLFLWHYLAFRLTIVAMLVLLACLIAIYLRLGIGRKVVGAQERWLVHLPFSIYLGWVTVATVANATSLLDYLNWGGWGIGPVLWTIIMLAIATLIAVGMSLRHGDIAYIAVIVWAFVGIAVKHTGTLGVAIPAIVLALAAAASLYWGFPRARAALKV